MRSDLNKLLCERERTGHEMKYGDERHSRAFKETQLEDDEPFQGVSSTHREGMKVRYRYRRKEFSENLNPLYGFIRKSVGRKWDSVYSEICEVFDKRSVINQHILVHLFQYVEQDIAVIDGKMYVEGKMYSKRIPLEESFTEYYVDPRDGILKINKSRLGRRQIIKNRQEREAKEQEKVRRVVDDQTELHLINDCWFEVKFLTPTARVFSKEIVH